MIYHDFFSWREGVISFSFLLTNLIIVRPAAECIGYSGIFPLNSADNFSSNVLFIESVIQI